jgi:type IV secretory pathway VirB4 component
MMSLQEYRTKSASLADFLPWVALVGPGVVLNKDGSFQRTARFRGPDLDSATPAELVAVTSRLNNALRRLGSGWAVFVEAQRTAAQAYPQSRFPDPVSALVDRERREQFREEGAHFESGYYLTLLWMPPPEEAARAEGWLYEGKASTGVDPKELVKSFADRTDRVLHLVEGFMPEAAWLDDAATLTYLHSTVSTKTQRVRVPETPVYLDALLADEPLTGGLEPMLGAHHLRTLTITGFPTATFPGLLDELNRQAFPYRWSTRAIMLDKTDATKLLSKIRRQWFAKRKVGRRHPQGGDDQRAIGADGFGRLEQGGRCRHGAAGAWRRSCWHCLCHCDGHGLGPRPGAGGGEAEAGRKGHSGPRLHLHDRRYECARGMARIAPRPCLRQCPAAAHFHTQSRPPDPPVSGMGGSGTGRAFR